MTLFMGSDLIRECSQNEKPYHYKVFQWCKRVCLLFEGRGVPLPSLRFVSTKSLMTFVKILKDDNIIKRSESILKI